MKFGIFYELQLPPPWKPDRELTLNHKALDQLELADRLGYDFAWHPQGARHNASVVAFQNCHNHMLPSPSGSVRRRALESKAEVERRLFFRCRKQQKQPVGATGRAGLWFDWPLCREKGSR